jgi:hypothetical protein
LWSSESNATTDPVELEYLNSFLSTLPSDSYLVNNNYETVTMIHTPSTGQFHLMSTHSSSGKWGNYSSFTPKTNFMEVTQINTNNIGVANDLHNLVGDFVSYTMLYNVGVFITQTSTGFETVKTLTPPSPPILSVSTISDTSKNITWTPGDSGDSTAIEKYILLLDGSVYVDNISPDATSYTATGLPVNTPYNTFILRKVTDLGSVDSPEPQLLRLRAHYDFTTDTLDEQITENSAYTLVQDNPTYGYQFVTINDTRWLNPVRKCALVAPIGSLLPSRNFTYMVRYYAPEPELNDFAKLHWQIDFGDIPTTADVCDKVSMKFEGILGTNPNIHASVRYTIEKDGTIQHLEFKPHNSSTVYADGSSVNPVNDFGYEHVITIVCNIDQVDGDNLSAQPGTIATYIDNKHCITANISEVLNNPFEFNDQRYIRLYTDRQQADMYFNFVKIFDGVVDLNTLNSLPFNIFSHTFTTGLSAKSYVSDKVTYDVGDVIDIDIITEGPTDNSWEVEFVVGLTSSPNGSDTSEYPQGSYNYLWYLLHTHNGRQVYRGDKLSANQYYKSQIWSTELYTQFINQYLRMTIISDSEVEYKFYTDSSRTTLHAEDPGRIITQQFSLPAYLFFGPEATESSDCNHAGNSIFVFKPETNSE